MEHIRYRYDGIQSLLQDCGESGCHFLCLCSIVEEATDHPIDLINAIHLMLSNKWMRPDFYVLDALAFLEYYTGNKWERREVYKLENVENNEYTEVVYYNPRTNQTHFTRRYLDPLDVSITVIEGQIFKYYIYKEIISEK